MADSTLIILFMLGRNSLRWEKQQQNPQVIKLILFKMTQFNYISKEFLVSRYIIRPIWVDMSAITSTTALASCNLIILLSVNALDLENYCI